VLGLHYTFATKFLVSLFDEKLSRREIHLTDLLNPQSRTPRAPGQGMTELQTKKIEFQTFNGV
jgi:hypothetical protein